MLQIASGYIPPELTEAAVQEIVGDIWSAFLDLAIERVEDEPDFPSNEEVLTGQVALQGEWPVSLTLVCPKTIARKAAAAMFNVAPVNLGETDLWDTVGELTHILGGNLKSLLPAPSHLSLPVVTEGYNSLASKRTIVKVLFQCQEQPLQITVFKQEKLHEDLDC